MAGAPKRVVVAVLSALLSLAAKPQPSVVQIPVRLIEPTTFPVVVPSADQLPKVVVLVTNPTPIARRVLVDVFVFGQDRTLLRQQLLSEDVGPAESALVKDIMDPVSIGAVEVRAYSNEPSSQPKMIQSWMKLGQTTFTNSVDNFGKRHAGASALVTNSGRRDAHVYLRFRLYDDRGYQVGVCSNKPPFFSDENLLVPAATTARLGCSVDVFKDVADVVSRVRVELLGWELRR